MDLFHVLAKLYTAPDLEWLTDVSDRDVSPIVIQKYLMMNNKVIVHARTLEPYVFNLPTRMYLALAWSVLPKYDKAPFVKYIKAIEKPQKYPEIVAKIRRILKISDNDWKHQGKYYIKAIESDPVKWFKELGIEKKVWDEYKLDFEYMRAGPERKGKAGLGLFF